MKLGEFRALTAALSDDAEIMFVDEQRLNDIGESIDTYNSVKVKDNLVLITPPPEPDMRDSWED